MARKAFQLLIQGTLPEERKEALTETITEAIEKALLPLDQHMIWIDSQMFSAFNPATANPAWVLVRGSLDDGEIIVVTATPKNPEASGPSEG